MKMSAQRFRMLLKIGTANGLIDPVEINFGEQYAEQKQLDSTGIVGVYVRYAPAFFTEYEQFGKIQIPADVAKALDKYFKGANDLDITIVDGEKLRIVSDREEYEVFLSSVDIPQALTDIEEKDEGLIPTPFHIVGTYVVDSGELKIKAESVTFEYQGPILRVTVADSVSKYKKVLNVVRANSNANGHVVLSGDYLNKVVSIFNGPVIMSFTQEGPVIFTQKTNELVVSVLLCHMEG